MNLFQILEEVACEGDILTVVRAIKFIFTLIQWAIPCVLIVLGTIDMFKAMTSGDEKATKEAQKKFIRRLIYAVVAFLIPFIISLVFTFVGNTLDAKETVDASNTLSNFMLCWNKGDTDKNDSKDYVNCKHDGDHHLETFPQDTCPSGYSPA